MGDSVSQPVRNTAPANDHTDMFVPGCPICGGATEPANEARPTTTFACLECATTVFVPPGAWATARTKRMMKWCRKSP